MRNHENSPLGKRALAALVSASLITTGVSATVSPVATAQTSVDGKTPRGNAEGLGDGVLNPIQDVLAGGELTITGTGFKPWTSDDAFIGLKINDGGTEPFKQWPEQTAPGLDVGPADTLNLTGEALPYADGNLNVTVKLPKDMEPGAYWIRVLAGADGDPAGTISKYQWFNVVEEPAAPAPGEEPPAADVPEGAIDSATTRGTLVDVEASGFTPGEKITGTVKGEAVRFGAGRRATDKIEAGATGNVSAVVNLGQVSVVAGEEAELVLTGTDSGTEAKTTIVGTPSISASTDVGRTPALGSAATITVSNVPEGTTLQGVGLVGEDVELLTDSQKGTATEKREEEQRDGTVRVFDEITVEGVQIPNDNKLLFKELTVTVALPGVAEPVT
ncbi:hypothetical protein [Corynebacterium cystitidis]|uniref:hypothetical protein n=1 Tax=Corynebacterium cystitidis TaxID=35757 RepID=UPI00211EBB6D|nr:hypothetical protein [Corynebacterium cystitidis]